VTDWRPLEKRIRHFLADRMAIEVASPETDLLAAGYLDSLALTELLAHLETEIGCRFGLEDLDLDRLRTVRGLAELGAAASGEERH
jgi:D-alanine--poly(phosphoribitol) ligase subunit 2